MSNLLKPKFLLGFVAVVVMFVGVVAISNTASADTCSTGTTTLRVGSKGEAVKCLQAGVGVSADGSFGPKTAAAVKVWQASKGLTADGVFGNHSRALFVGGTTVGTLPAGCTSTAGFSPTTGMSCASGTMTTYPAGCTSTAGFSPITGASCATGVVITQSGPLAVSLASDNPASGNVISGQATADLAHFTFTGTGTITQITLQRTGISNSSSLTNVYLYDGVTRLTDSSTVNTNGAITFNGLNIPVSGSKTVAVKADVNSTLTGSTIAVDLTSYTVAGGTASAVNLAGNVMYINDGTGLMATAVVNNNTVAASSISAGTMSYTLWSAPITVSTRAVLLKGASFKFIGSAPANAFANLKLYANGTQIASSTGVNTLSYIVFDLSSNPFSMSTGSTTLEVRGDVVNGSYRDGKLSLENASDLTMTDPQLNVNIAASGIPQSTPAGKITILQGSLISQIDNSFNALTTVTGGATNAVIARYKLTAYGEDMKVSQVTITPVLAAMGSTALAPAADGLLNVTLYWNGGQVGSSANVLTGTATRAITYTLGSNLIVPAGTTGGILEVRADIQTVGSISYTAG
jgi:peptidoglycan hydrolase-like protein with peptidoglycan-binding domain